MCSRRSVYTSNFTIWWKRYFTALSAGLAISCALRLPYNGYVSAAAALLLVSFGAVTLYSYFNRRRKIKAKDLVVITGCDSGLGYSLAMHCRTRGATVLAGIHRVTQKSEAEESLERNGIITHGLDITSDRSVHEFVRKVKEILKTENLEMRALVNNAGVMIIGEFEWQTRKHAEHQVNVNLIGTMRLTREMMPILRRQHGSRIIVTSSHCASESLPGLSVYGATKAGLEAWATSLRTEVGKYGVEVVSFIPGGFVTESGIMRRQKQYFDDMRIEMTPEVKEYYGEYFDTYDAYFSQVSQLRPSSVRMLSDRSIYEIFDGALLDIHPSTVYRSESWRYFFYRILFKITPVFLRDRLVLRFVQGPSWKPKK